MLHHVPWTWCLNSYMFIFTESMSVFHSVYVPPRPCYANSIMSMFNCAYVENDNVLRCPSSTISMFHCVSVPQFLYVTEFMFRVVFILMYHIFHCVGAPRCPCSILCMLNMPSVPMFLHVHVPRCLCSTMSVFHDMNIPPCPWSMFIFRHVHVL